MFTKHHHGHQKFVLAHTVCLVYFCDPIAFLVVTKKVTVHAQKKKLLVKTRWEYYVSNIIGLAVLIVFFVWFLYLSFGPKGLDIKTIFFWLTLLTGIILPFAIISFFSSMQAIEVTQTDLTISYMFQKHRNIIHLSDIREIIPSDLKKDVNPKKLKDTFRLVLKDGRSFEFRRAQFDYQYYALRSVCYKRTTS